MTFPLFEYRGVEFGGDEPIQVEAFVPGGPTFRSQTVERGMSDGLMVGRDFLGGATWSFDLFTDVDDYGEALDLADRFTAAWTDEAVRLEPGRAAPLRYFMADRWRRVYGRPTGVTPPDGGLLTSMGRGEFNAEFNVIDPLYYSDDEHTATVRLVPPSRLDGLTTPLTTPLTTGGSGVASAPGTFAVGGRASTGVLIEVNGPVSDAWVEAAGWRVELVGPVAEGETVTIDARPWVRATRRGFTPVSGTLSARTNLTRVALTPGTHQLLFGGHSPTGNATATLKWRNAWKSL